MTGQNILLLGLNERVEHSETKLYDTAGAAISELQGDNFAITVTAHSKGRTFTYLDKSNHEAVVISDHASGQTRVIRNRYPRAIR